MQLLKTLSYVKHVACCLNISFHRFNYGLVNFNTRIFWLQHATPSRPVLVKTPKICRKSKPTYNNRIYIYTTASKIHCFLGLPAKTCFFKIIRFFQQGIWLRKITTNYGILWVKYGQITGRNLENNVFQKYKIFFLKILKKKQVFSISTPKKWVQGAIGI
jgi:hypothetical protein